MATTPADVARPAPAPGAAVLWSTFAFALLLRVAVIIATPGVNYHNTDLEILRLEGRLVHAGVNPYDPRDGVATRASLLDETVSPTVRLSQSWWDYWVSANPPFNIVVMSAIDRVSHDPRWFRLVFAAADSLYAVLVMIAVFRWWPNGSRLELIASAAALGAGSLVLLQWGVRIPEDKGIELLLITAALVLLDDERRTIRVVLGAACLGLSVAFKALGIWLLPLCLFRLHVRDGRFRWDAGVFILVFACAAVAWNVPYLSQLGEMAVTRVAADVNLPAHASPFTWTYPSAWILTVDHYADAVHRATAARIVVGAAFIVFTMAGIIRGRISLEVTTAAAFVGFTSVVLSAGSLDRMNIAFVTAILLIGVYHSTARRVALVWYTALGFVSVVAGSVFLRYEERSEGFMAALGLLLILGLLIHLAVGRRRFPARFEAGPLVDPHTPESSGVGLAVTATIACAVLMGVALYVSPQSRKAEPGSPEWKKNPFLGTWLLNRERSKFESIERRQKETRYYEPLPDGTVYEFVRALDADGTSRATSCTARYDQQPYECLDELAQVPIGDIAYTRINEYIIDFVGHVGERRLVGVMKTSVDGQAMTVSLTGVGASGSRFHDVIVYDRE